MEAFKDAHLVLNSGLDCQHLLCYLHVVERVLLSEFFEVFLLFFG